MTTASREMLWGFFKVAIASRQMQWSAMTEGKQKDELAQTEFRCKKTIIIIRGRQLQAVLRLYISVALQQKTGNFKMAVLSRQMQWSAMTEEKQKDELAQKEFRFIKTITIIIISGGYYLSSFASTSALHCSKRRQTSRWPKRADQCSGVGR
jgi:dipeptide/tripeptide permease